MEDAHIKQKGEYIHHDGLKKASLEESGMHRGILRKITDAGGNCSQYISVRSKKNRML